MSYEQMILTVADNGLSSQRIYFQSTKQFKGHLQQNAPYKIILKFKFHSYITSYVIRILGRMTSF